MLQTRHNQYSNYRIFQSIFPLGKIYLPQIESGKAAWHRGQEVIYWGNVMSIKINRNKKTRCYNNILPTISNFQCSVVPVATQFILLIQSTKLFLRFSMPHFKEKIKKHQIYIDMQAMFDSFWQWRRYLVRISHNLRIY